MDAAIEAIGLTKRFGARKAVDDVTFSLPQGAFLSVFGPNGAGKTTLLRMIAALARSSAGSVAVAGFDARKHPDEVRASVGLISHDSMLYPDLTAEENLLFYARLYGVENPERRVEELLDAVGLRRRRLDPVRTFSRGMAQRAAIARALVHDPAVVLLDEPYAGLDPRGMEIFDELIAKMRSDRTFLMVSHDFDKGLRFADHALVMAKGRVVSFRRVDDVDVEGLRAMYRTTVGGGVA